MNEHVRDENIIGGGSGLSSSIQPTCSCGWAGREHGAYNSHQHSNAQDDFEHHVKVIKILAIARS